MQIASSKAADKQIKRKFGDSLKTDSSLSKSMDGDEIVIDIVKAKKRDRR